MIQLVTLQRILARKKYFVLFVMVFVIAFVILGISSAIFSPLSFTINSLADPIKVILVFIIAVLISTNIVVLVSNVHTKKHVAQAETILGTILALFVTTCPVCFPALLAVFGVGIFVGFLIDYSFIIALISIGILCIALYNLLSCASELCGGKNCGKSD